MGIRVLIIDDDPDLRHIWSEFLSGVGHDVFEAGSGEEGVALCAAENPQLVLVDWTLPGLRGAELLQQLRACVPDAHLVLVTGHGPGASIDSSKASEVLRKPFRLKELKRLASEAGA